MQGVLRGDGRRFSTLQHKRSIFAPFNNSVVENFEGRSLERAEQIWRRARNQNMCFSRCRIRKKERKKEKTFRIQKSFRGYNIALLSSTSI